MLCGVFGVPRAEVGADAEALRGVSGARVEDSAGSALSRYV